MPRQKQRQQQHAISLEEKVKINGGSNGYALEEIISTNVGKNKGRKNHRSSTVKKNYIKTPRDAYGRPKQNHTESIKDNESKLSRGMIRSFDRKHSISSISNIGFATPAYIHQSSSSLLQTITDSRKTPHNPYKTKSNNPPSSAKFNRQLKQNRHQHHSLSPTHTLLSKHIVCSISENLARETCITTMDATSPTTIEIHKMANGQTYIETLSYLEMICPHEVLLNEGRRNSQLCRKVLRLFHSSMYCGDDDDDDDGDGDYHDNVDGNGSLVGSNDHSNTNVVKRRRKNQHHHDDLHTIGLQTPAAINIRSTPNTRASKMIPNSKGECQIQTIVKFLPRSYFDQTRGAELLQRVAYDTSYDPSIINEYIVLSSSYSLVSYIQSCLGSNFNRNSLKLSMNWGGKYRMAIDRNTISHLELLANAKTGKNKNSLIGTIDCTKTSVGSRLLRSNLMSPPTGIATIHARLNLVDSFLDDEAFFYEVLDQLQALPDIDKMMAHIALVPNKHRVSKVKCGGGNGGAGKTRQVTARMASRGISALVCIKSILSVIPNFARVLETQLKSLENREKRKEHGNQKVKDGAKTSSKRVKDSDDEEESVIRIDKKQNNEDHSQNQRDINDDQNNNTTLTIKRDDEEDTTYDSEKENNSIWSDDSKRTKLSILNIDEEMEDETIRTNSSSLLIGLGGGEPIPNLDGNGLHPCNQLLRAILEAMKQSALKEILDSVLDIFTESTTYSRNSHAMRHQECFALKPNTDGMMDVLRKAFLANVDDIYKLADDYSEKFGFTVVVKETTARGYYLSIPVAQAGADLPKVFIQPVKSGKFYNCTTEEVHSLNSRAQENVQDLLLMTHERIQECIEIARQKYDALASLSDAIALIDMCHCFADNVASSRQPWCRPTVTDCCHEEMGNTDKKSSNGIIGSGAIAIRNGRFAIDVSKTGLMISDNGETNHDYIPNDTYASSFQNFTVITGINGSGKSTYLKQIAITVILAHCGSYVPAEEAYIPVRDRICTRIGTTDDQEHNISTFMQEMKDTAFICKNATDKSLILIDELGRATSNEDGVAIAWAIGEFLLVKRAMTFFVTHYPQLCRMADIYPNVQNQHLGAISEDNTNEILYTHKIMPGPCRMSADYGVDMASTCGWQVDVVQMARNIRTDVESKLPDGILCSVNNSNSNVDMIAVRNKAESILNNLAKHLVALKASEGRLNEVARRSYLQDLRDQFVVTDDESVVRMIKSLLLENNETVSPKLPLRPEGLLSIKTDQTTINLASKVSLKEDTTDVTNEEEEQDNLQKSETDFPLPTPNNNDIHLSLPKRNVGDISTSEELQNCQEEDSKVLSSSSGLNFNESLMRTNNLVSKPVGGINSIQGDDKSNCNLSRDRDDDDSFVSSSDSSISTHNSSSPDSSISNSSGGESSLSSDSDEDLT